MIIKAMDHGKYVDVMIDDDTSIDITKYNWHVDQKGYVKRCTTIGGRGGKPVDIYLHRAILGIDDSNIKVDHRNGDKLNCQSNNLRIATNGQNSMNSRIQRNNTSGHPGVGFDVSKGKWLAYITANGRRMKLGAYTNIDDAIMARQNAEIKYFGEFRRIHNAESKDV